MVTKTSNTYWARIYMSGPIETAKNVCRKHCFQVGLCVTIEPTHFIYTGGEESGFVIGLINYPRFPAQPSDIKAKAEALICELLKETHQWSSLLMTPEETTWYTVQEERPKK